jgi:hypothetical protein
MRPEDDARRMTPPVEVLHENFARPDEIVGPSDRRFGLTIAAILGTIGGGRLALGHSHSGWWLGAAAVLALFALYRPAVLGPVNRAWLQVGPVLYKIVNPITMALLFFSTIVPIGIVMRLRGKDPLRLRRDPDASSYWIGPRAAELPIRNDAQPVLKSHHDVRRRTDERFLFDVLRGSSLRLIELHTAILCEGKKPVVQICRNYGEEPATPDELYALLKPCLDEVLKAWPVDKSVGNIKNKGPQLITPIDPSLFGETV